MAATLSRRMNQSPALVQAAVFGRAAAPENQGALLDAGLRAAGSLLAAVVSRTRLCTLLLAMCPTGHSKLILTVLRSKALAPLNASAVVVTWLLPMVLALRALSSWGQWRCTKLAQQSQAAFAPAQRELLGLPPTPPSRPKELQQRRAGAPTPSTDMPPPLSPPQRHTPYQPLSAGSTPYGYGTVADAGGLSASIGTPGSDFHYQARTPLTGGSTGIGRPSPRTLHSPSTIMASPQQLQPLLDSFRRGAASPGSAYGRATPQANVGGEGTGRVGVEISGAPYLGSPATFSFNTTPQQQQQQQQQGGDQDAGGLAGLPSGMPPPHYRPSLLPKKSAVHAPDVLVPSSADEVEEFMTGVLQMQPEWLDLWTDRLREWMARSVLQPLLDVVDTAHVAINQVLDKYNQPARIPPLPDVIGNGGSSGSMDVDALLQHIKTWSAGLYQAAGNQPAGQAEAQVLHTAAVRYSELMALLRGKRPADLLPPAPGGYLWSRTQQLAQSTCLADFNWNGGGAWDGRNWTSDLPTDSALVLYLFAAFLDAPGWEFSKQGSDGDSSSRGGMPLFLGSLRSRPPGQYSAILSYRPDKPSPGADAILVLNLASDQNLLACFLAEGRILVLGASVSHSAIFHVILLFLQFHKVRYHGAIGGSFLHDHALGELDRVLQPPPPGSSHVRRRQWFGTWFPPSGTTGEGPEGAQ